MVHDSRESWRWLARERLFLTLLPQGGKVRACCATLTPLYSRRIEKHASFPVSLMRIFAWRDLIRINVARETRWIRSRIKLITEVYINSFSRFVQLVNTKSTRKKLGHLSIFQKCIAKAKVSIRINVSSRIFKKIFHLQFRIAHFFIMLLPKTSPRYIYIYIYIYRVYNQYIYIYIYIYDIYMIYIYMIYI